MSFRFGHLVRLVNFALLLVAIVIIGIFVYAALVPAGLNNFGGRHKDSYIEAGRKLADNALVDLENGSPDEAIALMERWQPIQKGDRYYSLKREVYIELTKKWEETKSFQSIVDFGTPILDQDDRDIVIFNLWAKAALKIEDLREETGTKIFENWKRFPKNEQLSELFLRDVYEWTDPNLSKKYVASSYYILDGRNLLPWRLYWTTNNTFTAENSKTLDLVSEGSSWRAIITVPNITKLLRFDPTPFQKLEIHDIKVQSIERNTPVLRKIQAPLNMVTENNGTLKTSGGNDPYFTIDIQSLCELMECPEEISLVVSLKVARTRPAWLETKMQNL